MTAIEKAQTIRKKMNELGTLQAEHNLIKKALADPRSKTKAIAAFCFHCMGGCENELPDPGWKQMIRTCTARTCPLYPHRPYKLGYNN